MAEKNIKSKVVLKHDIESNWQLATGFTPLKGEVVIYDPDSTHSYSRFKIGDGSKNVNALPFVDDALRVELITKINGVEDKVDAVSTLVGDTTVSEQISAAVEGLATESYVDASKPFVATYNTTTNAEIQEAINAGRVVFCMNGVYQANYLRQNSSGSRIVFGYQTSEGHVELLCDSNKWSTSTKKYMPNVTVNADNNGSVLGVVDGAWAVTDIPECPITSVNGKTGEVVLTAEDVGALPDTTQIPSIDGLATEGYVDGKIDSVTQLIGDEAVSTQINSAIANKSDVDHTHDDYYYTRTQVNTLLSEKANKYHGDHIPTPETTTNNARFLRSNNMWATVTPANIGAADADHSHNYLSSKVMQTTMPIKAYWNSVAYGNGKFVAVALSNNTVAHSTDGITWETANMPTEAYWNSVTYGDGKFVAVALYSSSVCAYSTDGITWETANMPSSDSWQSVAYGDGKFVAMREYSDKVAYSEDGINWHDSQQQNDYMFYPCITYGDGKFVAVCYGYNYFFYSEDGINNWTAVKMSSNQNWNSVAYGNGKFVATVYNSSTFAHSTDGITWETSTMPTEAKWECIAYGNGKFVVVAKNSSTFAYSTDGITWETANMPSSDSWQSVAYGDGKFVAVAYDSYTFAYSANGIDWKTEFTKILQDGEDVTKEISSAILPDVTEADNGKVLMVVNGKLQLVSLNLSVDANGVISIG